MLSQDQARELIGATLYGSGGIKIGKVGQVYLDDQTNTPEFATVKAGLVGGGESFVPLAQAQFSAGDVTVPYDKDKIKKAPSMPVEGHLSQQQEAELYRYYGLPYSDAASGSGLPTGVAGGGQRQPTGDAMTRSEERLRVGTEQVPTGRVRLRKYVETEQVQQSVPVTREQARVVREPITDANREQALEGPALSEDEHEITLREERTVVEKETVPVERVRLGKETVTEQQTVGGEVRKEVVETEGGERGAPPRR